jgi:threonine aldolase
MYQPMTKYFERLAMSQKGCHRKQIANKLSKYTRKCNQLYFHWKVKTNVEEADLKDE